VVHRHDGQVFTGHRRDQAPPQSGAHHHTVGGDKAFGGFDALDTAVFDTQPGARRVGNRPQPARGHGGVHQFARHHLRRRLDQTGIRIPQGPLDHVFLEQREPGLGLRRRDQLHAVAEGLARGHAALELAHALVITDARHLQAPDALVAA